MIEIKAILLIALFHWINDFICQDEKWALGKSSNLSDLLTHTAVYSVLWFIPIMLILDHSIVFTLKFIGITFIAHTITDFITSKIVSRKFARKELGSSIPNIGAFSWIGFDQFLHYCQLFLTYWYLTK
ncbi:MAG TPA: DUF3307 domain-containing protein [Allosphingosinicella sp.]|jgi:hypothetical protein